MQVLGKTAGASQSHHAKYCESSHELTQSLRWLGLRLSGYPAVWKPFPFQHQTFRSWRKKTLNEPAHFIVSWRKNPFLQTQGPSAPLVCPLHGHLGPVLRWHSSRRYSYRERSGASIRNAIDTSIYSFFWNCHSFSNLLRSQGWPWTSVLPPHPTCRIAGTRGLLGPVSAVLKTIKPVFPCMLGKHSTDYAASPPCRVISTSFLNSEGEK